ncbi:MAG: protein kinase [Steroidobacteraceae bacterium]
MQTSIDGLCVACLLRLGFGDADDETVDPVSGAGGHEAHLEGPASLSGKRIGNYDLLEVIARGGMGIVYRARQRAADRIVALKVMLPQLASLAGMRERFVTEIEAVARLDHPNILPIYEVGDYEGLPYFSMKLAQGGELDARIARLRGDWHSIASIVAAIARAVAHAHACGILHRDLKPRNILFDAQDQPLVCDFGLAKFRTVDRLLTLPASAIGSPGYMAPEQVSAEFGEVGPATDVYGLGAILYELLTGRPPIDALDGVEALRHVTTIVPAPPTQLDQSVPADLAAIALRCLAKHPSERYATAESVALDIERWQTTGSSEARVRLRWQRLSHRRGIQVASALSLVFVLAAWMYFTRDIDTRANSLAAPLARSIGVVPFVNASKNPADDDLTLIVTDDLLRELRQVDTLSVVPFRVRFDADAASDPAAAAAELGTELMLSGDIERRDRTIEVHAKLWDVQNRRNVWRKTFASDARDLLEMRSEIAQALVTSLQVQIGDALQTQLSPTALTANPAAYRKYLRGRYLLRWRRPETMEQAANELRAAVTLDPRFAQAYGALAAVYALWAPGWPSPDGNPQALALRFAHRALELDPRLAEAHAVIADDASLNGHYNDAEVSFRKALATDPRDPSALHFFAVHLYSVGKLREALTLERRSVALEPNSAQPMMWLAMLTTLRGDRNEALQLWRKSEELGAARPLAATIVRLELGQTEPLRSWFQDRSERTGLPAEEIPGEQILVDGIVEAAQREAAITWLHQHEAIMTPAFATTFYSMLGAVEDAYRTASSFDLVDDEYYSYRMANLWSPKTAALRADRRYGELAERWGLAAYWRAYGPPDLCSVAATEIRCH